MKFKAYKFKLPVCMFDKGSIWWETLKILSTIIPLALKWHSDHNPFNKNDIVVIISLAKWWGDQNPLNLLVCILWESNKTFFIFHFHFSFMIICIPKCIKIWTMKWYIINFIKFVLRSFWLPVEGILNTPSLTIQGDYDQALLYGWK